MMILEKLYLGQVAPWEEQFRPNAEYTKYSDVMDRCVKLLKAELSDAGKKTFAEYEDASLNTRSLSECDTFISGFRTGVLMMVDVFCPAYGKGGEQV